MVHVGRAMHGEDPLFGEEIVQNGEDGLLHLPGITGSPDEDELLLIAHDDEGFAAGPVHLGNGAQTAGVDDGEFRSMAGKFLCRRSQEEGPGEEGVPGPLSDDPDGSCGNSHPRTPNR